ncbi:hypothetical protein EDD86DRAFT_243921 [Gorgonomyces haynaldii]|nr:hypothetical protein EDD86DRAFT_243921 [Gorgonomyces haynaldii]
MAFNGFGPHLHQFKRDNEYIECWACHKNIRTQTYSHPSSRKLIVLGLLLGGYMLSSNEIITHECPECKVVLGFFDSQGKYSQSKIRRFMPGYIPPEERLPDYEP